MSLFLRNFFRRFTGTPAARISLAAFGKHPGWDDHVEIGVDTPRLIDLRRMLYVSGISGNVESGAWDKLDPSQRLPSFGHFFTLSAARDTQVGRLWASTDGKGRARYPLVACADLPSIDLDRALAQVPPILSALEDQCRASPSADAVREALTTALEQICTALAANGQSPDPIDPIQTLLARPEFSSGDLLPALLYSFVRNLSPHYPLGRPDPITKSLADHALHLRIPACADSPQSAARLWSRLARTQVGDKLPILTLQPVSSPWLDLFVGIPTSQQLFCLLASPAALPLTTDIPYNLDGAFVERATQYLKSWRS